MTERNTLNTHAAHMLPGVDAVERVLGCIIEGIGADQVLLRFVHLDAANADRECSLVLDIAQGYKGALLFLHFLLIADPNSS